MIFKQGNIGKLRIKNRIVRSATADSEMYNGNSVKPETLERYKTLAENNIGMIITGDFPAASAEMINTGCRYNYNQIMVKDLEKIPEVIHGTDPECRIFAQISAGDIGRIPSLYDSPWGDEGRKIVTAEELDFLAYSFGETGKELQETGFDGVQIHAAHGGFLSLMISPYSNKRDDAYGGSAEKNCRIIQQILDSMKSKDKDFPVIIKMNCTDYLPGGINKSNFQEYFYHIAELGFDAIELSGGMWEAMALSDEELGFPPVPALESHTKIAHTEDQSYFREFAAMLNSPVPVILAGGNRNYHIIDDILGSGDADFISFCRTLLCEPDLITRWMKDDDYTPRCISCNACIYDLWNHPGSECFRETFCLYRKSKEGPVYKKYFSDALDWIKNWKKQNIQSH